mgnify:CR=1 FL=1
MSEAPKTVELLEALSGKPDEKGEPPKDKEVGTCDIKTIKAISKAKEHEHGALLLFTHPDCPHCKSFKEEVTKTIGDTKVPILEASLTDADCMEMADKLHVDKTPTAFVYQSGKRIGKVIPRGKNYDKAMAKLSEMLDIKQPKEEIITANRSIIRQAK